MGSKHSNQKNSHYMPTKDTKMYQNDKKFETIQSRRQINCNYKCLCRIAFSSQLKQYIISDCEDRTLKILDFNGNYLSSINPSSILKCPWAIFIHANEIFVADGQLGKIIVFNLQFKHLRDFGDDKIDLVECLAIDDIQQNEVENRLVFLYAADYRNNLVTVWNCKNGKFKDQFKVQSPCDIAVNENKIYISSENIFRFLPNTRRLNYVNGENCILVLDKFNYNLLNKIKCTNWLAPNCLYFDKVNNHLITIAFDIDEDMNVSKTRFLYVIDQDTLDCLYRINLNVDKTSDMCIVDTRILFVRGPFSPPICMIEF
jgi:hypothetical protein